MNNEELIVVGVIVVSVLFAFMSGFMFGYGKGLKLANKEWNKYISEDLMPQVKVLTKALKAANELNAKLTKACEAFKKTTLN